MILIDKAKLMNHIENESRQWGENYDSYQILADIEDFDTVEAILIEYITNWAKHLTGYEQYQVSDIVNQLLQDWRKENETN